MDAADTQNLNLLEEIEDKGELENPWPHIKPLAKVVAGVLWGLNKGARYPLFINFAYLIC